MQSEDEEETKRQADRILEEETQGIEIDSCSSGCIGECCQITTDPNIVSSSPESWREHTDWSNVKRRYKKHRLSSLPKIVKFSDASVYIDQPFIEYGIERIRRLGQIDYINERELIRGRLCDETLSRDQKLLAFAQAEEWNRIADCLTRYESDFGTDFTIIQPRLQSLKMNSFFLHYYGLEGWK